MAAVAVEKPATFSRDVRYSSRNSQLGMTNLRYFDIINVSNTAKPVLLQELSTPQRPVMHLECLSVRQYKIFEKKPQKDPLYIKNSNYFIFTLKSPTHKGFLV
jgi:hypothetical protein